MTKLVLALLASAAFASPSLAATPAARAVAFEREGVAFVGTVTDLADGSQIVVGRDRNSGREFDLRVRSGQVTGTVGGNPVNYAVPQHATAATTVALISR